MPAQTGRPFTTHIAQAVVEVREMIRRHGITPIQWAADLGLLSPRAILGHAIFVDEHPSIGWHTAEDVGAGGGARGDGGALPLPLRALWRAPEAFRQATARAACTWASAPIARRTT